MFLIHKVIATQQERDDTRKEVDGLATALTWEKEKLKALGSDYQTQGRALAVGEKTRKAATDALEVQGKKLAMEQEKGKAIADAFKT